MVQKKRHLAKAISWRIIGTIDTMLIAGILTGNWVVGVSVGSIEVLTKTLLYYFHERIWYSHISFGLDKSKDVE